MKPVSSRQNPIVRTFRALAADPDPTGERLLLEGAHLVRDALGSGAVFEVAVIAASAVARGRAEKQLADELDASGVEVIVAGDGVFAALSPVKSSAGLAAIVRRRVTVPSAICGFPQAFVVSAVDVQDPGNVGALVRAAEAGGATGAFVCGTSASPFSWKALRGSMGSALRLPMVAGMTSDAVMQCMADAGVRTIAALPRGGSAPDEIDWRGAIALFLGGEGPGLSAGIVDRCADRVTIPMAASVESLNVAVAGAVLIYAARRQRVLT